MAKLAIRLLADPVLHAQFQKNGIERAATCFDNQTIMAQYEQIYYKVLNRTIPIYT
jgi:hypothetical protein